MQGEEAAKPPTEGGEPNRQKGVGAWVRGHPWLSAGAGVAFVAAVALLLLWFQPQALLYDTVVDEDLPAAADEQTPGTVTRQAADVAEEQPATVEPEDDQQQGDEERPADPQPLATGVFESRNRYTVEGTATVYEQEGGRRVLRLEDFSSTNGPDLFVYLTAADAADPDSAHAEDFVDLGVLSGNVGNQNYDIPDDVDLDRYDTVAIWCRRFTVGFGAADLEPTESP